MNFIKKHKIGIVISAVCLVLAILIIAAVYSMFNPGNSSRLDGELEVSTSEVDTIKSKLNESGIVNTVTYNKNIRIIKFIINVKDDTKVETAETLGDIISNNFNKEILSYYDIEIYITSNTDSYPIIGYHSKGAKAFTWTINRGEVSE